MKVKVKKLVPEAVIPRKAHASDAGFDLVAVSKREEDGCVVYGCGLAFEIPEGCVGKVYPRSSIFRTGLALSNSVGLVDAGYRGEVMGKFRRVSDAGDYEVGERFAQLVIEALPDVELEEAEVLSDSERGVGGYGSSGK